jgi:hypothetical protein
MTELWIPGDNDPEEVNFDDEFEMSEDLIMIKSNIKYNDGLPVGVL